MRSIIPAILMMTLAMSLQAENTKEPLQMSGARLRYEHAIETAKRTYAQELTPIQRQLTQQGDLEGALFVKAEIEKLEGQPSAPNSGKQDPAKEASYEVFKGHRYEFIVASMTRKKAEADCRTRGGYLACADTADELIFLRDLMRRKMVSPFWVDSKVGVQEAQWMRINGALESRIPKKGIEELPYICEWDQAATK